MEKKLDALGYEIRYNGELAANTSGTMTKQLAGFDDRADEMRHSLATLKRSYVIKLFADHADTQSLFGSLAKDLERLIGCPVSVRRMRAFRLIFQHVGYGPQPRRLRLLWADCAATEEIVALHAALLQAYGQTDERPFQPHVTLARLRADGPAIARKHPIDWPLSLIQCVESIELFQSAPPGGSGHQVLASLRLAETAGSASKR